MDDQRAVVVVRFFLWGSREGSSSLPRMLSAAVEDDLPILLF